MVDATLLDFIFYFPTYVLLRFYIFFYFLCSTPPQESCEEITSKYFEHLVMFEIMDSGKDEEKSKGSVAVVNWRR